MALQLREHTLEASSQCLVYYKVFLLSLVGEHELFPGLLFLRILLLTLFWFFFQTQVVSSHTCTDHYSVKDSRGPSHRQPELCSVSSCSYLFSVASQNSGLYLLYLVRPPGLFGFYLLAPWPGNCL